MTIKGAVWAMALDDASGVAIYISILMRLQASLRLRSVCRIAEFSCAAVATCLAPRGANGRRRAGRACERRFDSHSSGPSTLD
jgi:hypothetical protein